MSEPTYETERAAVLKFLDDLSNRYALQEERAKHSTTKVTLSAMGLAISRAKVGIERGEHHERTAK